MTKKTASVGQSLFSPISDIIKKSLFLFGAFLILYVILVGFPSVSDFRKVTEDRRPLDERMASTERLDETVPSPFASPVENADEITDVAEEWVRDQLIDPQSARFDELILAHSSTYDVWFVCGEVNAKNRFGGYTGARYFSVPMFSNDYVRNVRFGSAKFYTRASPRMSDASFDSLMEEVGSTCGVGGRSFVIEELLGALSN